MRLPHERWSLDRSKAGSRGLRVLIYATEIGTSLQCPFGALVMS